MDTVTLKDLGKEIQQMEGRLSAMRGEFENRQVDLGKLQQRKEQLHATLQKVESEIASLVGDVSKQAASVKSNATAKPAAKTSPTGKKKKRGRPKKTTSAAAAKTTPAAPSEAKKGGGATLRDVVTGILKSARKPLKTKELADRALEAGYQTKSTNFAAVVQDLIRKMDNLERVKNQGYQLKRDA